MPTIMISGAIRQYDKGTTFESIVKEYQPKYNYSIALVYFNGKCGSLISALRETVRFLLLRQLTVPATMPMSGRHR